MSITSQVFLTLSSPPSSAIIVGQHHLLSSVRRLCLESYTFHFLWGAIAQVLHPPFLHSAPMPETKGSVHYQGIARSAGHKF